MDRRLFLVGAGAGASTMLSGCVTTQGDHPLLQMGGSGVLQDLTGILQSAVTGGSAGQGAGQGARARLGAEASQAAFAAYGDLFNQIQRARDPSTVVLPGSQRATLEDQTRTAMAHINSLPDEVSDIQMAQSWEHIAPLINHLNRARSRT